MQAAATMLKVVESVEATVAEVLEEASATPQRTPKRTAGAVLAESEGIVPAGCVATAKPKIRGDRKRTKRKPSTTKAWCSSVATLQLRKATPEMRAALLRRCEAKRQHTRRHRKASKKCAYLSRSKTLWASSSRTLAALPMDSWMSEARRNVTLQCTLRRTLHSEDATEEAEELASLTRSVTVEAVVAGDEDAVGDDEFSTLLRDFQTEPADDEASAAKFLLYEQYAETVAAARKDTLDFWESCREDFEGTGDGAAARQISQRVAQIDREQNLAINFDERCWFVCSMTKKADANEKLIRKVLGGVRTKLDLLARGGECPVCFEELEEDDTTVLGCCHKVCNNCWQHWHKLRHGGAFCPICRYSDFVDILSTTSGVTAATLPTPAEPSTAPASPPAAAPTAEVTPGAVPNSALTSVAPPSSAPASPPASSAHAPTARAVHTENL